MRRLKYVRGVAAKNDTLKAGNIISDSIPNLFVDRSSETPLDSLNKVESNDEVPVYGFCLESEKTKAGNALNVKVYDYFSKGKCVVDMNYPLTHEAFLKGCENLAAALRGYIESNEASHKELVEGSSR
jgi:hypothetical protein